MKLWPPNLWTSVLQNPPPTSSRTSTTTMGPISCSLRPITGGAAIAANPAAGIALTDSQASPRLSSVPLQLAVPAHRQTPAPTPQTAERHNSHRHHPPHSTVQHR